MTVGLAARRRWPLVVGAVLAALALSLGLGLQRSAVYTAEARVAVGQFDGNLQNVAGFVAGVQALAESYSRLVDSAPVVELTAGSTGERPEEVVGTISASPIADSALIRIEAAAGDEQAAVKRANAAAESLAAYVARLNDADGAAEGLLADFRSASAQVAEAQVVLARARSALEANETPRTQAAVNRAIVQLSVAELRADGARSRYQLSQSVGGSTGVVTVFDPATSATSDARSSLQMSAIVGLGAGVLIGLALAMVLENLPGPRRRRA